MTVEENCALKSGTIDSYQKSIIPGVMDDTPNTNNANIADDNSVYRRKKKLLLHVVQGAAIMVLLAVVYSKYGRYYGKAVEKPTPNYLSHNDKTEEHNVPLLQGESINEFYIYFDALNGAWDDFTCSIQYELQDFIMDNIAASFCYYDDREKRGVISFVPHHADNEKQKYIARDFRAGNLPAKNVIGLHHVNSDADYYKFPDSLNFAFSVDDITMKSKSGTATVKNLQIGQGYSQKILYSTYDYWMRAWWCEEKWTNDKNMLYFCCLDTIGWQATIGFYRKDNQAVSLRTCEN